MSLGTTLKKCGCTNPATGRRYHTDCPRLRDRTGRWSSSHGSWHFQIELPRRADGFRRPLRHGGYPTETEAEAMLTAIGAALAVANVADRPTQARVGDLIAEVVKAGEPILGPEQVRVLLGLDMTPSNLPTMAVYLPRWHFGRHQSCVGVVVIRAP